MNVKELWYNNKPKGSVAYTRIKHATPDYQKSNYDNQTDNKDIIEL